jgi:hypothetical protein
MPASIWECSNKEYHADHSKIGASMLKVAVESPRDYFRRFVADQPIEVNAQTPAMLLGSAVHAMFLEPEKFDAQFAVRPDVDGRTTEGKKRMAEFGLAAMGKAVITAEVASQARDIVDSLYQEPLVVGWRAKAICEQAIIWEEGGLTFKCRPDMFVPDSPCPPGTIIDLKVSEDPTPECWLNAGAYGPMRKFRYDIQVAHYCAGVETLHAGQPVFCLAVVGKNPPHDVYCYIANAWLAPGTLLRQRAIEAILDGPLTEWRRPEQGCIITMVAPFI